MSEIDVNEEAMAAEDNAAPTEAPDEAPVEQPTEGGTEAPTEAPAEPEAEESEQEDTEEGAEENTEEEKTESGYTVYDDAASKHVISILENANVPVDTANEIFSAAVDSGDFSKIDVDKLVEAVGQEEADLALALVKTKFDANTDTIQAAQTVITDIVGDKGQQEALSVWVTEQSKDPAKADDFAELATMLDSGKPRQVKAAVEELYKLYKADPNITIPAAILDGDGGAVDGITPLSREAYTDAIDKATQAGQYEQKREGLWAQRQAGIKQNL
tara:strand:+ start:77 stop:895 length:819 start_codon:yes stop_codon:yes gene_type:complete